MAWRTPATWRRYPDYIEREDGFGALCQTYGLEFGDVVDIDIGLKYQALASGDIDVTNAFTTDAQLANPDTDLVTLADDKHLQVNYFCSTVVRQDALEKFPGLEDVLLQMDGILTDQEMASLNYQVEVEGLDEHDPEGPAGGVTWRSPSSGLRPFPSPMEDSRS